ncbi:MAG: bifunctional methylenetetrahydrofolate dehydrogenase/methenyltetrahydrofolate cyclohydrolase FolD [Acutalibacteraceae bacterium]|nr:bifunctional methylenetetrahydrofolate dehydrogenase/methenyltetrahydrofolate cyclohydrolase FolD [Acutalibacteraceae bacterium]
MKLIDGKVISAHIKQQVKAQVDELKAKGIEPCLAVIIVGDDFASRTYVNNKKRTCEEVGIKSLEFALPAETTQDELLALVEKLNADESVNGILCQLPIPKHIDEKVILNAIKPEKDVDAFHPVNAGHIMIGDCVLKPCTPAGIMEMLKYEGIDVAGKNCVVIGRSNIVGKPMAMLLLAASGTVTVCHSRTQNLAEITKSADILVAAVGKAKFVTADMVKEGAVVIDVGMNRDEDGKRCGDVDFEAVKDKASHITPVPGGVGLMTVAMLMQNTVTAAEIQNSRG